jgi:hypothetical protein
LNIFNFVPFQAFFYGHFVPIEFQVFQIEYFMVTLYLLSFKYFKLIILNMDYNTVTEDIIRLTDDLNTWSSTLCIPVKDSEALFDISSAANGADSCVPPGATNQPMTFPKSKGLRSEYRFDNEVFFGKSSWDDLHSMLRTAVSGCNISVHKTIPPNSLRSKYYILGCDLSRMYRQQGSILYLEDKVGPLHVVDEKAKRHKSLGTKRKG